jgi:nitric oxide synthase-interacting protein
MSCLKGHIFCKACIIENLVLQKQEIKAKLKKEKEEKNIKSTTDKEYTTKLENFIRVEDGITVYTSENLEEDEHERTVKQMIERKNKLPEKEKTLLTKNCFWIPEKTPEEKHKKESQISE